MMKIRAAEPADFEQILLLNAASVHFLSPLDDARLALLHAQSDYHTVLKNDGQVAAFLLAFRDGADYDGSNYRWFAARYPKFLYVDRIVVGALLQGRGAGRLMYENLFAFARSAGVGLITCEFDLDPPNPVSQRFHQGLGFAEVGTRTYGAAQKLVSMQALLLKPTAARSDQA